MHLEFVTIIDDSITCKTPATVRHSIVSLFEAAIERDEISLKHYVLIQSEASPER